MTSLENRVRDVFRDRKLSYLQLGAMQEVCMELIKRGVKFDVELGEWYDTGDRRIWETLLGVVEERMAGMDRDWKKRMDGAKGEVERYKAGV